MVRRQRDTGIDLPNDGEYGHSMGQRYDYGSWWTYVFQRLGGLELAEFDIGRIAQAKAKPGQVTLASFGERRDWQRFAEAHGDPSSGASLPNRSNAPMAPVCRGPITYTGQAAVQCDIADMKAALAATATQEGFLNSVAPGSCARFGNEYYADDGDRARRRRPLDQRRRAPRAGGRPDHQVRRGRRARQRDRLAQGAKLATAQLWP